MYIHGWSFPSKYTDNIDACIRLYKNINNIQHICNIYIYMPVFGLRLEGPEGAGGARQGAKISKIGAQI